MVRHNNKFIQLKIREMIGNLPKILVHFLFDDTILAENPNVAIGVILENEKEARLIAEICRAIEQVFEALGTEISDKEYINSSEWTNVVEAAYDALQVITHE